jgi:hypothetical protein
VKPSSEFREIQAHYARQAANAAPRARTAGETRGSPSERRIIAFGIIGVVVVLAILGAIFGVSFKPSSTSKPSTVSNATYIGPINQTDNNGQTVVCSLYSDGSTLC